MSTKLSFTLNLGIEDEPLIKFLQSLPRDQWELIIKQALWTFINYRGNSPNLGLSKEQERPATGNWNLEDLFVSTQDSSTPMPTQPINTKPIEKMDSAPATNPLSQLFQLIGEEDDQEVLDFFHHTSPKDSEETEAIDPIHEEPNPPDIHEQKDSFPSKALEASDTGLQLDNSGVGTKGLDFILNQVIGKEDDPEVLDFLTKTYKPTKSD